VMLNPRPASPQPLARVPAVRCGAGAMADAQQQDLAIDTQHDDMVHDAQLDYYGRRLATASSDRTIKVRSPHRPSASGRPLVPWVAVLDAIGSRISLHTLMHMPTRTHGTPLRGAEPASRAVIQIQAAAAALAPLPRLHHAHPRSRQTHPSPTTHA
jgi:hypothetical protein